MSEALVLAVALPFTGSAMDSWFLQKAVKTSWYKRLKQPWWGPAAWFAGPAWTILYCLNGYASYLIFMLSDLAEWSEWPPLTLYAMQLLLNWLWPPLLFSARQTGLAVGLVCVCWILTALTIITFNDVTVVAGRLMLPYLAWLAYNAAWTFHIWAYNHHQD